MTEAFLNTPIPAEQKTGAFQNYSTVGDIVKAHGELHKSYSSRSMVDAPVPTDPAQRKSVLSKLGIAAPETPDKYDLPANAAPFRGWAHKHGLTVEQARGIFSDLDAYSQGKVKEQTDKAAADAKALDDELRKTFGADYDASMAAVKKAREWLGEINTPKGVQNLLAMGKALDSAPFRSASGGGGGDATGTVAGKWDEIQKYNNDNRALLTNQNLLNPQVKAAHDGLNKLLDEHAAMSVKADQAAGG